MAEYTDIANIKTIDQDAYHKEIILNLEDIAGVEFMGTIRLNINLDFELNDGICKLLYTPADAWPDDEFIQKELVVEKDCNNFILLKQNRDK